MQSRIIGRDALAMLAQMYIQRFIFEVKCDVHVFPLLFNVNSCNLFYICTLYIYKINTYIHMYVCMYVLYIQI